MTDLRADSMTGEQWVLEERTADPTTTEEGERWLRTDLNSGDKIATLRVDVGNSIRDVPIFSTGTAVDTVSEAMRVQVNGVTGYVPIVPVSDAAYPELRMQHNSQVHGYHDRVKPGSAIPDSVVDNFEDNDLTEYTTFAGDFETRTSNVVEGLVAFGNASYSSTATLIHSLEGNGLDYYPQKGDKFSCLLREVASGETNLPIAMFGLFDDGGTIRGYGVNHFTGGDKISIVKIADNSFTPLETGTPSLSSDTWYDYEVEWHDGTGSQPDNEIVLTVYEVDTSADLSSQLGRTSQVASIQVNDPQYPNNRGIGFGNFTSNQSAATIADRYWHLGSVE